MADIADITSTFDNKFFQAACQDVLRIVSILSLDSTHVTVPEKKKSFATNMFEKTTFMSRFFYMVFVKGFTPVIFDMMPYKLWQAVSIGVYVYRLTILPLYLRLVGYGQYADWTNIGLKQPVPESEDGKSYKAAVSLLKETQLSNANFADPKYELFLSKLIGLSSHLSPHSQSPSNPFLTVGFPGNFFDHLNGVYKILLAWNQPRYVVRAGLFHSVYGTFDYRNGVYELRDGRDKLWDLIGEGAEELAFAICTADRLGMVMGLWVAMYGDEGAKMVRSGITAPNHTSAKDTSREFDGNPFPPLIGQLTDKGYSVRNHITQQMHVLPASFFAQFCMVMIADFMEQGAIMLGSGDTDICMFQFMRFRFYVDLMDFVKPYLRVVPPIWQKYMLRNGKSTSSVSTPAPLTMSDNRRYIEPSRFEVEACQRLWLLSMTSFITFLDQHPPTAEEYLLSVTSFTSTLDQHPPTAEESFNEQLVSNAQRSGSAFSFSVEDDDRLLLNNMVRKYPYLAEPRIILAAATGAGDKAQTGELTRSQLSMSALELMQEWGYLAIKSGHKGKIFKMKEVLQLLSYL
jgi:hypothetical protein